MKRILALLLCLLVPTVAFAADISEVTSSPALCPQSAPQVSNSSTNQTAAPNLVATINTPAGTPPPPNTLLDGTPVKLRLAENLSSESSKTGQQVSFEVIDEVIVQGVPVIPKGAQALATVTDAQPKRRMGRGGKLDVNVDSVRLADGEKVQLRAVRESSGGGHVGAMTGAMVATSIVFFPAAPLFLFMHGKSVEIPKGTQVTAFVQGDMHLVMARFTPSADDASAPLAVSGTAATPQVANIRIESSVSGADIEVDGTFVGSTPSTVSVAPGQHTVAVRKKGYADWSRSMNVSGSDLHLNADLEAKP